MRWLKDQNPLLRPVVVTAAGGNEERAGVALAIAACLPPATAQRTLTSRQVVIAVGVEAAEVVEAGTSILRQAQSEAEKWDLAA